MQNKSTNTALIPRVYCSIFGHDYQVSKRVTKYVKEYTCTHCKKQLTTSVNGNLVELTPKFREINALLEHIHQSKMKRLKKKTFASSIC